MTRIFSIWMIAYKFKTWKLCYIHTCVYIFLYLVLFSFLAQFYAFTLQSFPRKYLFTVRKKKTPPHVFTCHFFFDFVLQIYSCSNCIFSAIICSLPLLLHCSFAFEHDFIVVLLLFALNWNLHTNAYWQA